jgi:hypothetical protein
MSDSNVLRLELDPEAQRDLRVIKEMLGVDTADAIGSALGTEALLLEQAASGGRVIVIDRNGRQHEVKIEPKARASVGSADRR